MSGSAVDRNNNVPEQNFNIVNPAVNDPHFASDETGEESVDSDNGSTNASASASAGLGNLHVHATGSTFQAGYGFSGNGASAYADLNDALTVVADSATNGYVTITGSWHVNGTLTSEAHVISSAPDVFHVVHSIGNSSLTITGTGIPAMAPAVDSSEIYSVSVGNPQLIQSHTDFPNIIPLSFIVLANAPFNISLHVAAQSGGYVDSDDVVTQSGGDESSTADFADTVSWGGITSVTDYITGLPITDWSVTSASGFDYSQPYVAPEPATFILLGLALPGILFAKRRCPR